MAGEKGKESQGANAAESKGKAARAERPLRLGWAIGLVLFYWVAFFAIGQLDMFNFFILLIRLGVLLVFFLGYLGWWFSRRRFTLAERLLAFGGAVVAAAISLALLDRSVLSPVVLVLSIPIMLTLWTAWLAAVPLTSARLRQAGMLLIAVLSFAPITLARQEGMKGNGDPDLRWRFTPSAEERFVASLDSTGDVVPPPAAAAEPLVAASGDWTDFRGPNRDATVHGLQLETDWTAHPPKLLWERPVGPAWSSMVVVGNRLFTQEQRGTIETVSCFDADTGEEVWIHTHPDRFEEALGGVGPRATPTFAEGRIYALSPKGRLQAFHAADGAQIWSRNIAEDSGAKVPTWGFSGSPLVAEGRVFVYTGDEGKNTQKQLMAYDAETGDPLWNAPAGSIGYSSPQLLTRGGNTRLLMLGDKELTAFDPATGEVVWQHASAESMGRPTLQPRMVSENRVLVSFSPDPGISLVELSGEGADTKSNVLWASRGIKPDFSDFVHHEQTVYGFDGAIFCALNLEDGKRRWKAGRYGAGQVLLLADQPLLLVITEQGEVVLVAADPEEHRELAKLPAVSGKTWNHPALVGNRLFVRSSEQMACFELPLKP